MSDTFRNLVLGLFFAIMVGWLLSVGRGVILPVVASLILAYIVLGLAEAVGRLPGIGPHVPAPVRHLSAILVIVSALLALMSVILSNFGQVLEHAPDYQERLLATIQSIAIRIGVETEPTWETLRRDVLGRINIQQLVGVTVASLGSIVVTFFIVLIYAGFLLMETGSFARKIGRLSDDPDEVAHVRMVIGDINSRIGTYLVMKTGINVALGLLSYAVLRVAGIEFAGFWALLIGLFNYIPYVGGFIGVGFPVVVALMQYGDLWQVALLTLALAAAQVLMGNFIEPWLMGNSLNLSPFVILVSLVIWSSIWGLAGAILAVPVTAILVIVLSEFNVTRPVAVMLSKDGNVTPPHHRG